MTERYRVTCVVEKDLVPALIQVITDKRIEDYTVSPYHEEVPEIAQKKIKKSAYNYEKLPKHLGHVPQAILSIMKPGKQYSSRNPEMQKAIADMGYQPASLSSAFTHLARLGKIRRAKISTGRTFEYELVTTIDLNELFPGAQK